MLINGFKETPIGVLPNDWKTTPLKYVVESTDNRDPSREPNKLIKYVDVSSVSNTNYKVTAWKKIIGKEAPSRARKVVNYKDTIFATVRPYLKNIAQIPEYLNDEICSTGYCVIRANQKLLDPDFLFFVTLSDLFINSIVAHQRGSSYPAVSDKVVFDTIIPLPSLPEQRAIAHVLSTVRQAIDTTERVIAAAQELKRSMMEHLLTYGPVPVYEADQVPLKETEIGEMPEGWMALKIGDFAKTTSGGTPSREREDYYQGEIPWVKSGELGDSHIDNSEEHITVEALENSNAKIFPIGTLLVAMYGATAGKVGILDIDAATNQAVCAIFPDNKSQQEYLFYSLMSRREEILGERYGGAQPNVSQRVIRDFRLPIPPKETQKVIYTYLNLVDNKLVFETQLKYALDTLFTSLLHHLMTGKVRVPID